MAPGVSPFSSSGAKDKLHENAGPNLITPQDDAVQRASFHSDRLTSVASSTLHPDAPIPSNVTRARLALH